MKRKFLKKTISVIMASAMTVPTAAMNVYPALAETAVASNDSDVSDDYYSIAINSPKHGTAKFDDGTDTKRVKTDETLTVKATPDNGYQVKDYSITDTDGKIIASKTTHEKTFTFTVAEKSATVDVEFEKANNTAKPSEDADATQKYIGENLNDGAVKKENGIADKTDMDTDRPGAGFLDSDNSESGLVPTAHRLSVHYLYADSRYVKKDTTITDVWHSKNSVKAALADVLSTAQLYAVKGNENVYVAFTDAARMNGTSKATYADFTDDNDSNPTIYNDQITFDKKTGIVYIPRSLYIDDKGQETMRSIAAQFLIPYSLETEDGKTAIDVTIENNSNDIKEAAKHQTVIGDTFNTLMTIPLTTADTADYFSLKNTYVYLNGSTIPETFRKDDFAFDKETGKLTIRRMPAAVYSVRIVLNGDKPQENNAISKVIRKFSSSFAAKTYAETVHSVNDMDALKMVTLDSSHQIDTGDIGATFQFSAKAYYGGGASVPFNHDRDILMRYCYYVRSDAGGAKLAKDIRRVKNDMDHGDWEDLLSEGIISDTQFPSLYDFAFKIPTDIGKLKDKSGSDLTIDFGGNSDWDNINYLIMHCAEKRTQAGTIQNGETVQVSSKILNVVKDNGKTYAVFGFTLSQDYANQTAQGMYKIRINTPSNGYVAVKKVSDHPELCGGSSYSIKGAIYRVYESADDAANTRGSVCSITVDDNGEGVVSDKAAKRLTSGQKYYIRESQNNDYAPPGHACDINKYEVTAVATKAEAESAAASIKSNSSSLAAALSTEKTKLDPVYALVKKIEASTGEEKPLEGAEFTITRTDGSKSSKWVIKTRNDGIAMLDEKHAVGNSNSTFYGGLPLGNYTMEETKAPSGYSISSANYTDANDEDTTGASVKFTVAQDSNNAVHIYTSNGKIVNEKAITALYTDSNVPPKGRFNVNKVDSNDQTANPQGNAPNVKWQGQVIANQNDTWVDKNNNGSVDEGEKFSQGAVVNEFDTDDSGHFQEPNNIYGAGSYSVKETSGPDGYNVSDQVLNFTIANQGDNPEAKDSSDRVLNEGIKRGTFQLSKVDSIRVQYGKPQGDATLQGAHFELTNKSAHYVYVRGTRYEPGRVISNINGNLVTDANGDISLAGEKDLLPYGSYTIAETAPSTGYLLSTIRNGVTVQDFNVTYDGEVVPVGYHLSDATKAIKEPVIYGNVDIQKVNADVHEAYNANKAQGDSSFKGAVYKIYNRSPNPIVFGGVGGTEIAPNGLVTTLTTDDKGYATTPALSLPYGTYEVVEDVPSAGYLAQAIRGGVISRKFSIRNEGETVHQTWSLDDTGKALYEPPIRGQIKIKKNNADVHSDDPDAEKAQGDSTLKGAQFQIINRSKSYVWVDTNNNGKFDYTDANGNGKFEENEDTKDDECYAPGEVVCTLTTDENGKASTPEKYLPYGTYDVKEVKAPTGYLLAKNGFRGAITEKAGITIRTEGQVQNFEYRNEQQAKGDYEHTFYDAAPRGTFKFKKRDAETKKNVPLGGASFDGTYQVINRSKSYVWVNLDGSKDSNGNPTYDKSEKFAPGAVIFKFVTDKHTGYFDTYTDLEDDEKVTRADGTALDKKNFGRLFLPYGTYEIYEEVPPTGYLHMPKLRVQFSIRNKDASGREIQDRDVNEVLDMTDDEFHKDPKAKDQSDAQEKNAIYNYVKRGDIYFDKKTFNSRNSDDSADKDNPSASKKESYIPFRITSLDQDGKAVESHIVFTDANGIYDSRASYAQHTYRTNAGDKGYNEKTKKVTEDDNSKGHVGTWFGIDQGAPVKDSISDRTDENGKIYDTLGAFPYGNYKIDELRCDKNKGVNLFHGSFTVAHEASTNITEYTDPSDWANGGKLHDNPDLGTIYDRYVTISTEALEREHSSHSSAVSDDVDIIDSVEMNNLLQDEKYRLTASMVYSDTGEPVKNTDGTDLTFVKNFSAKNEFTAIKVPMNLDAEALGLGGRTVTVYEKLEVLKKDGTYEDVTSEEDKLDEDQQITFPGAGTTALADNGQPLQEAKKDIAITDTVAYRNFTKGKRYRIETYLVDKATGKYITVDGDKIAAQTIFKADKEDGTQDVKITFDATGLEGKSIVVFEKIYKGETLYAQHADINDEGQTIRFPSVHTSAADQNTLDHIGASGDTQIIDEVEYSNVIPGKEYTIKGRLVSKTDPTKVISESEASFTPEKESGKVAMTFNVNLDSNDGDTLVAYEDLYLGDAVIGRHENPDDEGQSIHKPKVGTTAIDKSTDDHVTARNEKTAIVDTVKYSNVIAGKEYTVKGELYNKETGKSLGVTAEKKFTAEKAEGTVDLEFTIDTTKLAGSTVVAFEDLYYNDVKVAVHADINDEDQSVHVPDIHTTAVDKASADKNTKYGTDTVITDTVAYTNLAAGKEYKIKGELYDKTTGQSIGVTAEKTFTPESSDGSVDLEFTVDTTKLQGTTLVAFETMTYKDVEIAVHADINDIEQTVYVPEIHTTATSETTGSHTAAYSKTEKIKDSVEYKNLIVGKEYTVKGELYDKATGQSIGVKAERTFTAETSDGTVELEFTVDTTALAGKTVVAFEDMQHNGVSVGVHADINDVPQSVNVPGVKTTATDKKTGSKNVTSGKKVTVTDTVSYTGLTPGKEYTVSGELYSKKTGKSIGVKAERKFTAAAAEGTVKLDFTVDSTKLAGQTLVAFENLYEHKVLVGVHADIKDEDQTVYVPELHTTAKDKATGTKTTAYGKKTVITDVVKYSNLVKGQKYTVKGELYSKKTGKSISSKAQKTFTAKKSSGSVTLSFTVDTTKLAGQTVVAFEKLYYRNTPVGVHENINDKDQSVYVPDVHTTASVNSSKTGTASAKLTITDKVAFRNLVKGQKYTVTGELHDKATGKALSISGKKVTSSRTFTATSPNGYINVRFTFDARACGGRDIVVFEKLYLKGKLVGQHADLKDRSQTVHIRKPVRPAVPTKPAPRTPSAPVSRPSRPGNSSPVKRTKTGDATSILPYVAIAAAAVIAIAVIIIRRRKE